MECSVKSGRIVAHKKTQVFSHDSSKTSCSRRVFYEWTTVEFTRNEDYLWWQCRKTCLLWLMWPSQRIGYQSKLLVVLSKGGRLMIKSTDWLIKSSPDNMGYSSFIKKGNPFMRLTKKTSLVSVCLEAFRSRYGGQLTCPEL